ncbi:hypothetical protein [Synechocystis sp. LKSZ1]
MLVLTLCAVVVGFVALTLLRQPQVETQAIPVPVQETPLISRRR